MNSYKIIRETSKALRTILWRAFENDSEIRALLDTEADIVFKNPTETAQDSTRRLSIWLYHLCEDEHTKNRPPVRAEGNDPTLTHRPPLALNLSYLITPFTLSYEADMLLLGRTMQLLYDNATFLLRHNDEGIAQELRLIFNNHTLADIAQIWAALREPYHLSVCYQVRVARIASERQTKQERVRVQQVRSKQKELFIESY